MTLSYLLGAYVGFSRLSGSPDHHREHITVSSENHSRETKLPALQWLWQSSPNGISMAVQPQCQVLWIKILMRDIRSYLPIKASPIGPFQKEVKMWRVEPFNKVALGKIVRTVIFKMRKERIKILNDFPKRTSLLKSLA
jgi:hypothetical protein